MSSWSAPGPTEALKRLLRARPRLEREFGDGPSAEGVTSRQLGCVIEHDHEVCLGLTVGVDELGEVGVEHLERLDPLEPGYEVHAISRGFDCLADPAGLGTPCAALQRQIPALMQPPHHLLVDRPAETLAELRRRATVAVAWVLACDRFQRRSQLRVLVLVALPRSAAVVVPRRACEIEHRQHDADRMLLGHAPGQFELLSHAHPLWSKKFPALLQIC